MNKRGIFLISVLFFSLFLVGLGSSETAAPAKDVRSGNVKVMTQNVYVGADTFRITEATNPYDVPILAAQTLQIMQYTNFPERAEAIVDEIEEKNPDLIALQEISLIRVQSPGDFMIGNPESAEYVLYDYLAILMAALEARGLEYKVVAVGENLDVEVPYFAGFIEYPNVPLLNDVRLTDYDVILARESIATANADSERYVNTKEFALGPFVISTNRGITAVDAEVRGVTYRVVTTHLDVKGHGYDEIQALQAQEIIEYLNEETLPVILLGDFNSAPEDPATQPYSLLTSAGFMDAWVQSGTSDPGLTFGQSETLTNEESTMNERIDYIFFRSNADVSAVPIKLKVDATMTCDEPADKTVNGLWPSDHAGVYSRIQLPVLVK